MTLKSASETKKVKNDLNAQILLNLSGQKAANVLIYIEDRGIKNCDEIKFLVLREFKPMV